MEHRSASRPSVAVIGSGVAGLTAAHLLQRRYDVHLFEADDRLGGHAHTHDVPGPDGGAPIAVDSGFLVHNERTYPQLVRLFGELGIATTETDMSMSVSCRSCGLEYAGALGPNGVFAQRRSVARPRFLWMLGEITAFHRRARALLAGADAGDDGLTLGAFLARHRHTPYFTDHFVVPLVSAVWSAGRDDALAYPARFLFRFLDNHGMLAVGGSPRWRTVTGGSRSYVERAAKNLTSVRTATPVRGLRRGADGVWLREASDTVHRFDHAVVATHADQALRLLEDPTPAERDVLGTFGFSVNETVLHTDATLLPRERRAWASWNHVVPSCGDGAGAAGAQAPVAISYHLNRLHRLGAAGGREYVVTLGATDQVAADAVVARMVYAHPIHTVETVAAQRRLPDLATGRTVYAGAWHGWGFHEDGCASGVRAAAHLGVAW
ncbi:NAD(P)/FAD-dependent oxidoreductase [Jiangella mangrovi]|uniref:Putative NAD/FAD-binding protein n=1 Tax=Jiangella mangrovi TaxID=1524084 RepID=A0A7W9GMW8_9ACTN|nr:FAD-dependent oxidoreductase [Jiangella mangrovi]MBB5786637.1 putative NAD/FAD-binding protein [Jiangella mangrovi]